MSGYPLRLQATWLALLAVIWCALCAPWAVEWATASAVIVVGVALIVMIVAARQYHERNRTTSDLVAGIARTLQAVPAALKRRTPLAMVVGELSVVDRALGGESVRLTDAGLWVGCGVPENLIHLADALKRWRDGQGPEVLVLLVSADNALSEQETELMLQRWRAATSSVSRMLGYVLPVSLAVYAEELRAAADPCPWFGVSGGVPIDTSQLPAIIAKQSERYVHRAAAGLLRVHALRTAYIDSLVAWSIATLIPPLVDERRGLAPMRITGLAATVVNGSSAGDGPFNDYIEKKTGLRRRASGSEKSGVYPLPEPLWRGVTPQPAKRPRLRAFAHGFIALMIFLCAASASSAWQNYGFVSRLVGDTRHYASIEMAYDAARVDALSVLKRDRDLLERYAQIGVPLRLGFGLYRGDPWSLVLNRLIASYRPPPGPPALIVLDSMSLFDSGKSQLKTNSTRALVSALEMIKAHPDKRVLVAGYADSIGNPKSNLLLSEARAAAVRDWLVDASGLSPTRFAIQGYGDTRPQSSNDTDIGRAANRRVDITLVPDCRDDDSRGRSQGQSACS